ncbi:MAG: hypothetical protein WAV78_53140 [Xanthobacteraceae bacterium]|jgi:hypothetical protein
MVTVVEPLLPLPESSPNVTFYERSPPQAAAQLRQPRAFWAFRFERASRLHRAKAVSKEKSTSHDWWQPVGRIDMSDVQNELDPLFNNPAMRNRIGKAIAKAMEHRFPSPSA